MASIPCVLIVLLICLSQDHMGVQGETPAVFSSVGGDVTLPCSNVGYQDCSSTTWTSSSSGRAAVELVLLGKIRPDVAPHRAKRLSLDSDCSLHITDVTTEDAEVYTCQQYLREGGPQHYAHVYLSVLQVSASPSETEMEADSHVTLHCLLHTYDNCTWSVEDKGVSLSWVDETGKDLQIRTTPPCSITLTEELRGPNPVHTWTCQLTAGGQVQTSVSHTIRVKGLRDFKTTISTPSSSPESTASRTTSDCYSSPHSSVVHVAVRVATTISLFVAVIIVAVIYRMRSGDPQGKPNTSAHSVDSAVTSPSL